VEGDGKIGLGAIVSAGSFVSAFVVGAVALAAAPFAVYDGYLRDVAFYFVAVLLVFAVFASGHIHLWQAVGLVIYYCVFVVYVVWIDSLLQARKAKAAKAVNAEAGGPMVASGATEHGASRGRSQPGLSSRQLAGREPDGAEGRLGAVAVDLEQSGAGSGDNVVRGDVGAEAGAAGVLSLWRHTTRSVGAWWDDWKGLDPYEQMLALVLQPLILARRMTVPDVMAHDRLMGALNTMLCPLLLLLFFNDFIDFDMPVGVFGEGTVPLWSIVGLQSSLLAAAQWVILANKRRPRWMEHVALGAAFVCSIAWISMIAQELLSCLSTLGHIMGLSPAIMGVTVLAWGNSIGDLVADVALARAGEPVVALAGCYAGPMFNMLIGLGLALTIKTAFMYPQPYGLHYDPNVPVSFGFLFIALISSAVAVALMDYKITKAWGACLVGLYLAAMATSILVESSMVHL